MIEWLVIGPLHVIKSLILSIFCASRHYNIIIARLKTTITNCTNNLYVLEFQF